MGTLYVVATPIGNLADTTARAAEILRSVALVAAEDTRVTKRLLNHIKASPKLVSFHANSTPRRMEYLLKALDAHDIALVTDAGTPAVSDPGAALVRAASAANHRVVSVPGPSAVVAALSVSGFPADRFVFAGFLPRTSGKRKRAISNWLQLGVTVVCFESPHRIIKTLTDLNELLPDIEICVCREITKLHEEKFVGTPAEALEHFNSPKGEFVLLLNGSRGYKIELEQTSFE